MKITFQNFPFNPAVLLGFLCFLVFGCKNNENSQEKTGIINARIWTGNPEQPWAEAMAIEGEQIILVGTNEEVKKLVADGPQLVDAGGKMVTPGFNDSHIHFIDGGFGLSSVQLRDAKTKQEFIDRIGAFAKTIPAGSWILAGDWDHTNWGGELPQASWIDSITPKHPVFIQRLDGHMGLANSLAINLSKVTAQTPDMDGGTIVRDKQGKPAGIFKDNAMSLIAKSITDPSDELKDKALQAAMDYVIQYGVTSIQNMGTWGDVEIFRRAHKNKTLKTRVYSSVPLSSWKKLKEEVEKSGRGDDYLKIGGLKGFVDGSLGSHTAAFKEAFTDTPTDSGFLVNSAEELYNWISPADKAGLQLVIHSIGDRAIGTLLDIYERVEKENGPRDRRYRIEHAQHLLPGDFQRFKKLNVIASVQPYHAIDDGRWAESVIGPDRIKRTYAFKSFEDAGVVLAFGSDWFVAPPTPLEGIYAAVTRRTIDDKLPGGWVPEQKITVEQALKAYTTGAAFASFDETKKGMLKKGMLADFVILDQDITTIAPEKIRDVKVLKTVVGGKTVYERKQN